MRLNLDKKNFANFAKPLRPLR